MRVGILFDLDGTLLDTLQDLTDSTNAALRHFSCPERTREEMRRFIGNGARMQITRALPGTDNDPDVQDVLAFYRAYYQDHCQIRTAPYPGVGKALAELTDYPIAIVSNKPDGAVKALCSRFFPNIYAVGELADCPRKPAPDMIYRTMAHLGVDSCIYVGDSEVDVQTAKNAGVRCLCVTWGFRDEEDLRAAGAQRLCHAPEELAPMLKTMIGEYHGQ